VRVLRVALVGFGSVGRRLAEHLGGAYRPVLRGCGVRVVLTGVATARHGIAIDPRGLAPSACLRAHRAGSLAALHRLPPVRSTLDFIARVPADVLVELGALDPRRGQPAIAHVTAALRRGMHVVTANKGPVAFALARLRALARRRGRLFLYESAVMDGAPVFNLVERCLPGVRVRGFRGTLNSTTGYVLSRVERGADFASALRAAQRLGIVEADARHDLDGWDAAVKGCALAAALMGARVHPDAVVRRGIRGLSAAKVRRAARAGTPIRLVVRAQRRGRAVRVRVAPERLAAADVLAGGGSDSALVLETDLMGELAILERGGTVDQTAYGVLGDLLAVAGAGLSRAKRPPDPRARRAARAATSRARTPRPAARRPARTSPGPSPSPRRAGRRARG
jgi:homoserine dehydrogenase